MSALDKVVAARAKLKAADAEYRAAMGHAFPPGTAAVYTHGQNRIWVVVQGFGGLQAHTHDAEVMNTRTGRVYRIGSYRLLPEFGGDRG